MRPRHPHSRGQTTVLFVLAVVPLLGMAGLAIDVGRMYTERRRAQAAADLAASSGAQEASRLGTHATFESVAGTYASRNGFSTSNGDTIAYNHPPTSGAYAGNPNAYEVVVRRPVSTTLLKVLGKNSSTVEGRSIALVQKSGLGIIVLEPSKKEALRMNKKSSINLKFGTVYVNSISTEAIKVSQDAALKVASKPQVVGGFKLENQGVINPPPETGAAPISDPLAGLPVPPCSLPVRNGTQDHPVKLEIKHATTTLCPGIYYGGLVISENSKVTFDKCGVPDDQAVFAFSEEGLHVHGSELVTKNVMIYNAAKHFCVSASTDCGQLHFDNKATLDLTPPTGGTYEGLAIYQDRTCNKKVQLSGAALSGVTGEIYLANAELKVKGKKKSGSGDLKASLVVRKVSFGNYVADDDALDGEEGDDDPEFVVNSRVGGSGRRVQLCQ